MGDTLERLVTALGGGFALFTAVSALFLTFISFRSSKIKIGNDLEIKFLRDGVSPEEVAAFSRKFDLEKSEVERPFEVVALSNYYNHALLRANVSFWFSIVFAAIGFAVIIVAFATHKPDDLWGTVVRVASGTVIDAVSGLFFVQSTNAQKSMTEFFEKLRLDRMNADARAIIAEIEDPERRDQLRAQLVLKYAQVDKLLVGMDPTPRA